MKSNDRLENEENHPFEKIRNSRSVKSIKSGTVLYPSE